MNAADDQAINVLTLSIATLALLFNSSAYTNSIPGIIQEYGVSRLAAVVGVSIYVLGFAVGPMVRMRCCSVTTLTCAALLPAVRDRWSSSRCVQAAHPG